MIQDMLTIMWKDWKGLFHYQGSRSRLILTLLSPVILAIYMPLDSSREWVDKGPSLIIAVFIPIILVALTITDSFAGERERHTLETLLASRLPDRAILLGKMAVSVAFGWGLTVVFLLVSLVVFNLSHLGEGLALFAPAVAALDLLLSFLLAVLTAGVGVIISLRAATVQQAAQTLTAILLMPPLLLGMLFTVMIEQIEGLLSSALLPVVFTAVVAVIDVMVLAVVLGRFRRARLVLD